MRNIFDQYKAPENRLTHGLACSLNEDRRLLADFVFWITQERAPNPRALRVFEQQIPGQPQDDGEEPESEDGKKRGLPDVWIHDDDQWSLMMENKIAAPVDCDQLKKHIKTAERNGFDNWQLLVISPELPTCRRADVVYKTWIDIYEWMRRQTAKSEWAERFAAYMEVTEAKLMEVEYLKGQPLTSFDGIHFDVEHEYNYLEAKRAIKLMMPELRKRKDLQRVLRINHKGKGHKAIAGRTRNRVWDYIDLNDKLNTNSFTSFPHFTVNIGEYRLLTHLVVPNGYKSRRLRVLLASDTEYLHKLIRKVETEVSKAIKGIRGAYPRMQVVQRHYPSIGAKPFFDADLEFDLRTANPQKKSDVKHQSQWLDAAFAVLRSKKSNIQWVIGASFPFGSPELKSAKVLDRIAGVWLGCKPILDDLVTRRGRQ